MLKFLCASAGKNQPLINNYVIKFLLVVLMKHREGLEYEKSELTLTHWKVQLNQL